MSEHKGILYVVATPIGNLGDLSPRALAVMRDCDWLAAEDTRHSAKLLHHGGVERRLLAFHEHNERAQTAVLIGHLQRGEDVALISDAGTPLISDPGYRLVQAAHEAGVTVMPVPGPCAAIAALSAAGLPSDRFVFEGFPPARPAARRACFQALRHEPRTLVFYESPHRLVECVADMAWAFGGGRVATLARELSKQFESVVRAPLSAHEERLATDPHAGRGEFVIVVAGAPAEEAAVLAGEERVLGLLLKELPLRRAVALAAEMTGGSKNRLYAVALALAGAGEEG